MSSPNVLNPSKAAPVDRAVLVGVYDRREFESLLEEYLAELAFLAETAGAQAVAVVRQFREAPNAATLVGKGKLQEVKAALEAHEANLVIFDEELTPAQLRNIEKELECTVLDRTSLILFIFSQHARTAQSKTQVELAQLEYELPRLRRKWTHLGRERGGIGLKGAGEQEIETDRRIIRQRIARLKEDLKAIDRQNQTRRKNREQLVRASLVGYTNAGKSSLMNALSKAEVLAENKLFATLDTTVRKVVYQQLPFLLADTVGFIRKLPHKLVESFKSTLDEVREADLLLHVVDASNHFYLDHIRTVNATLAELNAQTTPTLMVFNKMDLLEPREQEDLKESWLLTETTPAVFVSTLSRDGLPELRELLYQLVLDRYRHKYPGAEALRLVGKT